MVRFASGQEIMEKYDQLYKPVFFPFHLYCVFTDEHDYDVSETELSDEKIMLTMGHYFSLEEGNVNKAKYFYDKVTKLNSPMGLYSLGVFFYTKSMYPRAKLYAINGLNMNCCGSTECAILLFKISVAEKDFEKAEKYLIDEIERLEKQHETELIVKIAETLCIFYSNIFKNNDKLEKIAEKYVDNSFKIRTILAQHYYNIHDSENLIKHAEMMIKYKMTIGNYYMGMYNFLQFTILCKNGLTTMESIKQASNLLEIAETWFGSIVTNDEIKLFNDHTQHMINKIHGYKKQMNSVSVN